MQKVTKEQFFAKIGPMDVVIRADRDQSIWETRGRVIVGRSTPGYMCSTPDGRYTDQKEWFLA